MVGIVACVAIFGATELVDSASLTGATSTSFGPGGFVIDADEFALPVLTVAFEFLKSLRRSSCAFRFPIASEAESDLFLFRMAADPVSMYKASITLGCSPGLL
jgi:hypothetical protein